LLALSSFHIVNGSLADGALGKTGIPYDGCNFVAAIAPENLPLPLEAGV
jgi:hypothetical protein